MESTGVVQLNDKGLVKRQSQLLLTMHWPSETQLAIKSPSLICRICTSSSPGAQAVGVKRRDPEWPANYLLVLQMGI